MEARWSESLSGEVLRIGGEVLTTSLCPCDQSVLSAFFAIFYILKADTVTSLASLATLQFLNKHVPVRIVNVQAHGDPASH